MKYSIDWLLKQKNYEFLFFWGHQPGKDGSITKSCLSQWWPSNFKEDNVVYKTAEHYMMAQKAILFGDLEIAEKIITSRFPKDVKELGRQIKNFNPIVWDTTKYEIVKQGNYLKFTQNKALQIFLKNTGNKILVETSPTDTIWGIGFTDDNPKAVNPLEWRGQNLLGFALMEIRDKINKK